MEPPPREVELVSGEEKRWCEIYATAQKLENYAAA